MQGKLQSRCAPEILWRFERRSLTGGLPAVDTIIFKAVAAWMEVEEPWNSLTILSARSDWLEKGSKLHRRDGRNRREVDARA